MAKTAYLISLKGYVGGYDFDRSTVDRELARNDGKQVNVLIDSLGGSLATGLSISAAFKATFFLNRGFSGKHNFTLATSECSLHSSDNQL